MRESDWRERLREQGYRLTPQRELVLDAVEKLGHATPDEVLAEVRDALDAVNVSTVYRTLEVLEELGLVRHAHLSATAPRRTTRSPTTSTSTWSAGIATGSSRLTLTWSTPLADAARARSTAS